MTGPHVDQLDRDHLDDFGLVDDDQTEDRRIEKTTTPGLPPRGRQNQPLRRKPRKEDS